MSKNKVPENETKEERSKRLMEFRIVKVLERLKQVKTLAKSNQYIYTEEQKDAVIALLEKEINDLDSLFSSTQVKEDIEFKL